MAALIFCCIKLSHWAPGARNWRGSVNLQLRSFENTHSSQSSKLTFNWWRNQSLSALHERPVMKMVLIGLIHHHAVELPKKIYISRANKSPSDASCCTISPPRKGEATPVTALCTIDNKRCLFGLGSCPLWEGSRQAADSSGWHWAGRKRLQNWQVFPGGRWLHFSQS